MYMDKNWIKITRAATSVAAPNLSVWLHSFNNIFQSSFDCTSLVFQNVWWYPPPPLLLHGIILRLVFHPCIDDELAQTVYGTLPRELTDMHGHSFSFSLNKDEMLFTDIC